MANDTEALVTAIRHMCPWDDRTGTNFTAPLILECISRDLKALWIT